MNRVSPTLSIISINKDHAAGLRRTLQSIAAQSWRHLEVIVVDGHSVDGSHVVPGDFADLDLRWFRDRDRGIYPAMNQGLEAARGTWALFLNAGDILADPDVLSRVTFPDGADVVSGQARFEDEDEPIAYPPSDAGWLGMFLCHQAAFCRTEVLKRLRFDTSLRIAGDYDLFARLLTRGYRFQQCDQLVAVVERGGISEEPSFRRWWENYRVAVRHFDAPEVHRYYMRLLRGVVQNRIGLGTGTGFGRLRGRSPARTDSSP